MPVINFEIKDVTKDQKKQLVQEFTDTAARVTGIPKEMFYVFIKENNLDNIGVGGKLLSETENNNNEDK
ncbi:4-oxalocrotonate tautomerase DmpI [Companilactobacillus metriopterae]|uniref:4-oxalocrotonate tautomerase DmpI n=1 Tax=Companilactobacillus metriopterae TaxID=1909267 RepID=UPI00100B18C9|nr:4-oxalocrotonate tautomerase DmpI [Companilactobacillus metriopterae]